MKELWDIEKIDNTKIKVIYNNNSTKYFSVIKIDNRKKALAKSNAFEKMDSFFSESDYESLRNYEIEDYLDNITGKYGHRINELCPHNGFMWFD